MLSKETLEGLEREKLARRLIELGTYESSDFDDLVDKPNDMLKDWLIEALEETRKELSKKLTIALHPELKSVIA